MERKAPRSRRDFGLTASLARAEFYDERLLTAQSHHRTARRKQRRTPRRHDRAEAVSLRILHLLSEPFSGYTSILRKFEKTKAALHSFLTGDYRDAHHMLTTIYFERDTKCILVNLSWWYRVIKKHLELRSIIIITISRVLEPSVRSHVGFGFRNWRSRRIIMY